MPKPLFLSRPSGLYVRFRLPSDIHALLGLRFIVRPLHLPDGDGARLAAARMAMALSMAFERLRRGDVVDIKKVLDDIQSGKARDILLRKVELPNGVVLSDVQVDTEEDQRQLQELMRYAAEQAARGSGPRAGRWAKGGRGTRGFARMEDQARGPPSR